MKITVIALLSALWIGPTDAPSRSATIVVATKTSSERSRAQADFVGDGQGDQKEINAAVGALPPVGGTVLLMEGTYDIRKVPGKLGGVLIERNNIVLAGQGTATVLLQAPGQETNVIRIIGEGVGHVTIRDLVVDANRDKNPQGGGDPAISHSRFEFCGIKAFCQEPGKAGPPCHDITVRNCRVLNARSLGIMLEGPNMRVIDNVLGNAMSDSVEILTGPGQIRGNYVEITGRTHVAIGTDRANSVLMTNNIVHVKKGGDLDIGFRSWADSHRHVIADNVLTVDSGGKCGQAIDARGYGATIIGNNMQTADPKDRLRLTIGGGKTIVTGNVLENVVIEVNDTTGKDKPIIIHDNVLENSTIVRKRGNLPGPAL
ncbi:MAG: right-handed parallel beta-helix repeat-containing protein [Phycisphaerae bacterium]|nr:right-handed parallel beta-helix repeat-containing protein [Phycisphaerae bacterium]